MPEYYIYVRSPNTSMKPSLSLPLISFIAFSRWDIIAERLGFMLVFGDLVFIPFTFTIQVSIFFLFTIADFDHCLLSTFGRLYFSITLIYVYLNLIYRCM